MVYRLQTGVENGIKQQIVTVVTAAFLAGMGVPIVGAILQGDDADFSSGSIAQTVSEGEGEVASTTGTSTSTPSDPPETFNNAVLASTQPQTASGQGTRLTASQFVSASSSAPSSAAQPASAPSPSPAPGGQGGEGEPTPLPPEGQNVTAGAGVAGEQVFVGAHLMTPLPPSDTTLYVDP